ncbi:methyltransferase domain-containing protein [Bradyrhizobium manausense]|uniref:class I SAM-dependent methyltransferase n=1 Tax=Bradyrhizobium manausense TaxID=989370 RepID=UPI001BADCFDA|nr:class I SAM-dependent methyltransferase [Bradyrhizobium manausense]MBR1092347.1 methyltransferase domain-containing protein [Bradyrhizobium manausense]
MSSNFISKGAEGYDQFMGRWSKRLAPVFLEFAGAADGERIIDVGCGTGSLTFLIPDRANISTIEAIDYEEQFVEALRQRSSDPRITARLGDACALPFGENQFDRALSMLVLHFVSDPRKAVAEMFRVVRPGGVVAATVWDTFGGMPSQRIFWDTIAAIEPSAVARRCAALVRPMTFPGEMMDAFAGAGLQHVTEAMLTIRMEFAEFDDYWLPLINGQGTLAAFLSTLPNGIPEQVKASVRQAYLCGQPDGPRSFASVAWAVKGTVPMQ